MMTRSTVSRVRWVTATADAKSIHSSLASGGGEAGRTCYTAGIFNHAHGMNVAALLKRCCSTSPAINPTDGSRRIGLRSLYQAQSRLNAIRMGSAFPCPSRYHGISEGHERYAQVRQPPVRFGLPLGMEQSKRDRGRGT